MIKFLKRCAIVTMILFILGGILLGVALMSGAGDKVGEVVSKVTNGKVTFHWDSWKDWGLHISDNWKKYDIDDTGTFDKNHEVWKGNVKKTQVNQNAVDKLDIQIGGNYLMIKESEDEFYYIEQSGDGKLQAYDEQGVLYVKAIMNDLVLGVQNETNITLYVPEETDLQKINVELGAGKIEVFGLNGKELDISMGAGNIEWDSLMADSLKLEMGAGKLTTKNAVLGDVKVSLGAGDCRMQGEFQGDVGVNCAAGKIVLTHVGTEAEFNYDISCTAGSIKIDGEKISGVAETQNIDNNASKTMKISVTAGDVEVEFE